VNISVDPIEHILAINALGNKNQGGMVHFASREGFSLQPSSTQRSLDLDYVYKSKSTKYMDLKLPLDNSIAFHVDLDGLWVHANDFSDHDFREHDDYVFRTGFEAMLEAFGKYGIKATLFVVGRELLNPLHLELMKEAKVQGHAFANHSFSHPKNLSSLTQAEKEYEIKHCDEIIRERLNTIPIGFRAPAYYIDKESIGLLKRLGYRYDSSIFPSPYGPIIASLLSHR